MTLLGSFFQDETFGFQISVISEPSPCLWRRTGGFLLQIDRLPQLLGYLASATGGLPGETPTAMDMRNSMTAELKPGKRLDSLSCVLQIR